MDVKSTIVIDLGSGYTKVGIAENEFPSSIIPTHVSSISEDKENLSSISPIQHGIILNYEQIEDILDFIFNKELKKNPEEHPILLTQPPKNPQKDKEKLAEILFETFKVPYLYEEVHSVLTFYSSGRSAGLIVESGHGVTSVVPILSGFAISEGILRLDIGGGDLDKYLMNLLMEKNASTIFSMEQIRILKEKLCYISEKKEDQLMENLIEEIYTLPDGKIVNLGNEKYLAADPLFDPSLLEHYDAAGIHEMIFQSIFKCSVDLRKEFANNIILSGGNTLFNGLETRLKQELETRVPPSMKINIISDPARKIFVWRGGSILGSLSTFTKNICVSRNEYEEFGDVIIRKKCMNGL